MYSPRQEQEMYERHVGLDRPVRVIDAGLAVEEAVGAIKSRSGEFGLSYQGMRDVFLDFDTGDICRDVILALMDPENNPEAVKRAQAWMSDRAVEAVDEYWRNQGADTKVVGRWWTES